MITRMNTTCTHCGKTMDIKPYRLRRSARLFCGTACRLADGSTLGRRRPTAPPVTCPVCSVKFHRKPAERVAVNYCSYACAAKGTGNLRAPSKGERRSRSTEFGAVPPPNRLPVGSITIRVRVNRGNDRRAWVKTAEPNVWRPRAVVVWESAHGPTPRESVIHHMDGDSLNDAIRNLARLSRAEHAVIHHATPT